MAVSGLKRRVLIVDDSRTIQAMLDNAFSNRPDFQVVGFSGDAKTAVEMIRRLVPDIVTIDLCMPYLDGAALLGMISDLTSVCKIVVSDASVTNMLLTSSLLQSGASVCIGKSELVKDPDGFFRKINAAADKVEKSKPIYQRTSGESIRAKSADNGQPEAVLAFPIPADEIERLRIIRYKNLANAIRERQFDLVTKHVAKVISFPACLLTFIDRDTQWIKSAYGLEAESTPRNQAFCNYTISQGGAFIVTNAATDERFSTNPLVTGAPKIRSYVGHTITSNNGVNVGTLCVIDYRVRTVSRHILDNLAEMSDIIGEMINMRPPVAA